jgi:putative lipoprotein
MKKIIFTIILIITCSCWSKEIIQPLKTQHKDPWFGVDKLKHLSSAFMFTTTGYYIQHKIIHLDDNRSVINSGMITISLGLGKEISDAYKPNGFFSFRDLLADGAGIALAVFFIRVVA